MDFTPDLSIFLSDFAEPATISGEPVMGLFTADYATAFGEVSGYSPVLEIDPTQSPALAIGAPVSVAGGEYTIVEIQPDHDGLTLLRLRKA
jgi:hypothetical protein